MPSTPHATAKNFLEASGISVSTIDLSEIFGSIAAIGNDDPRVHQRIEHIRAYADSSAAPDDSMIKMAKFALAVDDWMNSLGLTATAIQCWSSMQKNYGVNVCTIMSMMSEQMLPSACEVDIAGVVSMYALQLASGRPSALVDWNNNYGKDPDKCVFFHCGNWAKDFLPDIRIGTAPILGTMLGEQNTVGALKAGRRRALLHLGGSAPTTSPERFVRMSATGNLPTTLSIHLEPKPSSRLSDSRNSYKSFAEMASSITPP